jgi:tetratricopeptide (TPR) repeat protein
MQRETGIFLIVGAAAALAGFFSAGLNAQQRYDHQVRNVFFAGFQGDKAAIEKGMAITAATLKENPDHAEALVWHGAGLFYQAGQFFMAGKPDQGMPLAQRALMEMDRAVALEPNTVGVRIPRGASLASAARSQNNPSTAKMFLDRAIADFEAAYELQKEFVSRMSQHARGELLLGIADLNSRQGNLDRAAEFFTRIAKEMPGTPYAESAALWLETRTPLPPTKAGCFGCHTGK